MREQSLVDLFDLYDQAFDAVCSDLNISNTPNWQERWFYRYLLINPVLKFCPILRWKKELLTTKEELDRESLIDSLYKSSDLVLDERYSDLLMNSLASSTATHLNPRLHKNFSEWWFLSAKNRIHEQFPVKDIDFFSHLADWLPNYEERYEAWVRAHSSEFEELYTLTWDRYRAVMIPRVGNRKQILKEINNLLDEIHVETSHIVKSKISEKTIKDCFRVLEYLACNGETNLLSLAENADVLKFSRVGLRDEFGSNSSNSVKVGVHRLSKLSLEILKASSFGFFPTLGKWNDEDEEGVHKVIADFFKLTSSDSIDKIYSLVPATDSMESCIRAEIKELGGVVYE
jgi:hypothetical protein